MTTHEALAGNVHTQPISKVPNSVGPVMPALDMAKIQSHIQQNGGGVSLQGSVYFFRGGEVQETLPDLPATVVPVGSELQSWMQQAEMPGGQASQVPGLGNLSPGSPNAALFGEDRAKKLDPRLENPAMEMGGRGKISDDTPAEETPSFSKKAAAINLHLRDIGNVWHGSDELAGSFGQKLVDLMLGSMGHKSSELDGGPSGLRDAYGAAKPSPAALGPGQGADVALARGAEGLDPVSFRGLGVEDMPDASPSKMLEGTVPSNILERDASGSAGSMILPKGFPGIGLLVMEASALTLRLSQILPDAVRFLPAVITGGRPGALAYAAVQALLPGSRLKPAAVPAPASRETLAGFEAELPYPGGYGAFLASVGNALAPEAGVTGASLSKMLEGTVPSDILERDASAALEGWDQEASFVPMRRGVQARSLEKGPASRSGSPVRIPFTLLSYALLPLLALAVIELRAR